MRAVCVEVCMLGEGVNRQSHSIRKMGGEYRKRPRTARFRKEPRGMSSFFGMLWGQSSAPIQKGSLTGVVTTEMLQNHVLKHVQEGVPHPSSKLAATNVEEELMRVFAGMAISKEGVRPQREPLVGKVLPTRPVELDPNFLPFEEDENGEIHVTTCTNKVEVENVTDTEEAEEEKEPTAIEMIDTGVVKCGLPRHWFRTEAHAMEELRDEQERALFEHIRKTRGEWEHDSDNDDVEADWEDQ